MATFHRQKKHRRPWKPLLIIGFIFGIALLLILYSHLLLRLSLKGKEIRNENRDGLTNDASSWKMSREDPISYDLQPSIDSDSGRTVKGVDKFSLDMEKLTKSPRVIKPLITLGDDADNSKASSMEHIQDFQHKSPTLANKSEPAAALFHSMSGRLGKEDLKNTSQSVLGSTLTIESVLNSNVTDQKELPVKGKETKLKASFGLPRQETTRLCFPLNSKTWLDKSNKRRGNFDDPLSSDDFVFQMILNHSSLGDMGRQHDDVLAMNQTICHTQSRFRNTSDTLLDERSANLWITRLAYLAVHENQHRFAVPEAKIRYQNKECTTELLSSRYHLGRYDYECPGGKFIVVPIENIGVGSVMRLSASTALQAGLALNRTVVFMNRLPKGRGKFRRSWVHASCARGDTQCFFQPVTPCVLTSYELENATVVDGRLEVAGIFRRGRFHENRTDDRVFILPLGLAQRHMPTNLVLALRDYALGIIHQLEDQDPRLGILQKVVALLSDTTNKETYARVVKYIQHAFLIYAMRPNPTKLSKINHIVNTITPSNVELEATFGLPVRASDKCFVESECLTFEQNMRVLSQIWTRNKGNLTAILPKTSGVVDVILTTESESVLQAKDAFMSNETLRKSVSFPFRFIINDFDVMQDTGHPTLQDADADEVMLSVMSSLKAQLMARYSVGNCCSNFHRMLFELLDGGCGATLDNSPECLQTNENPEFRICCVWSSEEECKNKKVAEKLKNNTQHAELRDVLKTAKRYKKLKPKDAVEEDLVRKQDKT